MDDFTKILLWSFGFVLFIGLLGGGSEESKPVKSVKQNVIDHREQFLDNEIEYYQSEINVLLNEAENVLEE